MPDLKELFDLTTADVEPDLDAWEQQERRHRRAARNRKAGGFAAAAAFVLLIAVIALILRHESAPTPTHTGSTFSAPPASAMGVVIGLDGSVRLRVLDPRTDARSLSLSPDGRTIAFVDSDASGVQQIGTVGIGGGAMRFITHLTSGAGEPAWSRDGSRIAFVAEGHVHVVNADGSHLVQVTSGGGRDSWPSWSPDGSTIIYANSGRHGDDNSEFSDTQEIWSTPSNGGTATRLTHNSVPDDMPAYSPDGSEIAFFHGNRIWFMNADGSNPRELARQPEAVGNVNPRWSPDGSHLLFLKYKGYGSSGFLRTIFPIEFTIEIVDLSSGTITPVPGTVKDNLNVPSWLPSGDALLVNFYYSR